MRPCSMKPSWPFAALMRRSQIYLVSLLRRIKWRSDLPWLCLLPEQWKNRMYGCFDAFVVCVCVHYYQRVCVGFLQRLGLTVNLQCVFLLLPVSMFCLFLIWVQFYFKPWGCEITVLVMTILPTGLSARSFASTPGQYCSFNVMHRSVCLFTNSVLIDCIVILFWPDVPMTCCRVQRWRWTTSNGSTLCSSMSHAPHSSWRSISRSSCSAKSVSTLIGTTPGETDVK